MTADAWGVIATLLIATVGGVWTFWKWRADVKTNRQRMDGLYVNPLMFAAQDLQSRLYNLLDYEGLGPLRAKKRRYEVETLYLIARYFAFEVQMLRFTNLDVGLIGHTEAVREVFADNADTDRDRADPWCIFRTTQNALGQSIIEWRQGEVGFADTKSLVEFEQLVNEGLSERLGLKEALESLRNATTIKDLQPRSRRRLADVQSALVDVLDHLEARVSAQTGETFSLFPKGPRAHSEYRSPNKLSPAAPPTSPRR